MTREAIVNNTDARAKLHPELSNHQGQRYLFAAALAALLMLPVASGAQGIARSYQHEARQEYRQALRALDALDAAAQGSYFVALRRGWLLYRAGEHRASIRAYQLAIARAKGAIEPLLGLTLPQMALRLWVDCSRASRAALALDPRNYLASSRLAHCSYQLGHYRSATERYRQLVVLYPGDLAMRAGLAWALLREGKTQQARTLFADIVRYAPAYASAREGLSWIQKGASMHHP